MSGADQPLGFVTSLRTDVELTATDDLRQIALKFALGADVTPGGEERQE